MSDEASPPSFLFCLVAALPPIAVWCCFLSPVTLFYPWLPITVAASYLNEVLSDQSFFVSVLHLYAAYQAINEENWERWWTTIVGMFLLSKAMGLAHESIWDAFEPLLVGRKGHGAGTRKTVAHGRKPDMTDKDGKPLGSQSLLVPGTQVRVDTHDGRGFQPFIIPGDPTFPSERKAIEAFFTKDELSALKEAGVRAWDEAGARKVLAPERFEEIRSTHGLWKQAH
jgi:hypothetical protein